MKIAYLLMSLITLFSAVAAAQMPDKTPLETVTKVDLARYSGKWYEIARYPNRFQKQCVGNVSATYTLKPNGNIEVKNECLKSDGKVETAIGDARIVDKQSNAKLKVRFAPSFLSWLPMVWGKYWVIDLDPEYRYAVIGEPDRDYFWILSREPTMSETLYAQILQRAKDKGFDPGKVKRTNQSGK